MPFEDYQIPTRPMTPNDAFTAIIEMTRHAALLSRDLNSLRFETTIDDWTLIFDDDVDMGKLDLGLNEHFGTAISKERWREVLEPAATRTLGDICNFIAPHARKRVIEPVTVMGDQSRAAGAFLVVRRILHDAGVDVSDLRPSSPIGPYFLERFNIVVPQLQRLAPGLVPSATVIAPAHLTCSAGAAVSYLLMLLLALVKWFPASMVLGFAASFVFFFVAARVLDRYAKPMDVRIGAIRDFRDLCRVLVGERAAVPGFPMD